MEPQLEQYLQSARKEAYEEAFGLLRGTVPEK